MLRIEDSTITSKLYLGRVLTGSDSRTYIYIGTQQVTIGANYLFVSEGRPDFCYRVAYLHSLLKKFPELMQED